MATLTERKAGTVGGLAIKAPCYVATTGNITLSATQTVDGIAVGSCERVLVKDQTDASENGIYLADSSTWVRAQDFDGSNDALPGTQVYVRRGTQNGDSFFALDASSTATLVTIGSNNSSFSNVTVALSNATVFGTSLTAAANAAEARTDLGLGAIALATTITSTDIEDAAVKSTLIANAAIKSSQTALGSSATGDMLYYAANGTWTAISIGTSGQVLTSSGGVPKWLAAASSAVLPAPDFTGTTQALTNGSILTVAHGLADTPTLFTASLRCLTAEKGFSTGMEVVFSNTNSNDANNKGHTIYASSTAVEIRVASNGFEVNSTAFGPSALTAANWGWIVRAWS